MSLDLDYVHEHLSNAVSRMNTSTGSPQERLLGAYISHLSRLLPGDLPSDLAPEVVALEEAMMRVEPRGNEGSAEASTRAMSDAEANNWLARIAALQRQVAMMRDGQQNT